MELLCSSRQQKLLAGENEISICDSGILTPVGNANALAKAMSIISDDEKMRKDFIKAGQIRVKDFDSSHILELFKKIIFQQHN
jgi:glycosyltransferase involved in cell wall biosynthesis